jgi:hypothetical protein
MLNSENKNLITTYSGIQCYYLKNGVRLPKCTCNKDEVEECNSDPY